MVARDDRVSKDCREHLHIVKGNEQLMQDLTSAIIWIELDILS